MSNSRRAISFVKASACGNDFLLIDAGLAPEDITGFTRHICDRHEGVGADGVEWMQPHSAADIEVSLINADGSHAEISGNGTRCVAAYLCSERGSEKIRVQTGAGLKTCTLIRRSSNQYEFEAEMGDAKVEQELALRLGGGEFRGIPVSMGNPHYVSFVSSFAKNWRDHALEIQADKHFVDGVNVEFVIAQRNREDIDVLFYERGAGETRSSGTGSCASAVAAVATGRAVWPVRVHAPGGVQTVDRKNGQIVLRGTAGLVCRGEFFLD